MKKKVTNSMKASPSFREIAIWGALAISIFLWADWMWLSAAQQQGGVILVPERKTSKSKTKKNVENPTPTPTPILLPEVISDSAPRFAPSSIPLMEPPVLRFETELIPPAPAVSSVPRTPPVMAENFTFKTVNYVSKGRKKWETERMEREKSGKMYREQISGDVWLELVEIAGGEFTMGSFANELDSQTDTNRERPRHKVKVPGFWIGKYEVTQAQWRAVAQLPQVKIKLGPDPSKFKGDDNLPVDTISWYEAIEFCARLEKKTGRSYRLLTEAEWEYAARAGTATPFAFGETITPEIVNYDGNNPYYFNAPRGESRGKTIPVGSLGWPNAFGLFDMHGNLWEWCRDQYHPNYDGAPKDGSAWESSEPSFKIVEQSIVRSKSGGLPDDVLNKLQRMKDYAFVGEEAFLARLKTELGEEQTAKFKAQILEYASWDPPRVIRGGSWGDGGANCRSATRADYGYPYVRHDDIGLRIAVTTPFR